MLLSEAGTKTGIMLFEPFLWVGGDADIQSTRSSAGDVDEPGHAFIVRYGPFDSVALCNLAQGHSTRAEVNSRNSLQCMRGEWLAMSECRPEDGTSRVVEMVWRS